MDGLFDQIVTPPTLDENKDYLSELVGDGKKFKDAKELAKGKAFSDAHISTLEQTLASMREELRTRATAEDLINQINLRRPVDPSKNTEQQMTEQTINENPIKPITPEDVERMFAERDTKRQRESNLNLTSQKLKETFGDTAAGVLGEKARELGLSTDYLKNMAQEAPTAFLALFNKPAASSAAKDIFSAPPQSSFRPAINPQDTGEKWSEFNKVKKENPNEYWSPKFQRKIMEAAEKAMESGSYERFMAS